MSTNTFRRDVGSGSKDQGLDGDLRITELAVSCETGSNTDNEHNGDIMGREHDRCCVKDVTPALLKLTIPSEK